jgi:hypothetical protein
MLTRMFFSEDDKDDPETGVVLSGGQWQRVALARAMFPSRRDLMILDEPSAGLDPEADVHGRIRRQGDGATPGCSGSRPVATRRRLSPDNDGAAPARPHGWAGAAFSIVSSRSR